MVKCLVDKCENLNLNPQNPNFFFYLLYNYLSIYLFIYLSIYLYILLSIFWSVLVFELRVLYLLGE
jgi:hypothetical protein